MAARRSSGDAPGDATDRAIGLLETKTLARGIEALDAMIKEAPIAVLWTRAFEPGRYLVLIAGSVDDVRTSLRRGRTLAADDVHDEMFLAGPHRDLAAALERHLSPDPRDPPTPDGAAALEALGLIECASVAATLLAADAAAKDAHVALVAVRFGADMHGKGLVALRGEPADVASAVATGAARAEERGMLVRTSVIPQAAARAFEAAMGS